MSVTFHKIKPGTSNDTWTALFDQGQAKVGRYPDLSSTVADQYFTNVIHAPNTIATVLNFTAIQHGTSTVATSYRLVNKTTATTIATVSPAIGTDTSASINVSVTVADNDQLYFEVVTEDTAVSLELVATYQQS